MPKRQHIKRGKDWPKGGPNLTCLLETTIHIHLSHVYFYYWKHIQDRVQWNGNLISNNIVHPIYHLFCTHCNFQPFQEII